MIKEIQFLRGLAIILVFFFHINENLFFLGFLGVDIFFVISGYIISKNIIEIYFVNKEAPLKKFFIKRFLRLYPSLFLVVNTSLIFFLLLSFRVDNNYFLHIYKSAISSLVGFSNIYFSNNKESYFFNDQNPFLHTWSLSLEEQFYLLSFFFLAIFIKLRLELKLITVSFFVIFSVIIFNENNFFHLHYRFHEFLIGSLIYFLPKHKKINFDNLKYLILFLFIISIAFYYFIDKDDIKSIILFTVILTSSIIYFIVNYNSFLNVFFKNKILIHLGDLSYTLYLVHFPIIIIFKFLTPSEYILISNILVLLSSYGLSIIIYKFYEYPIRKSKILLSFCQNNFRKLIFLLIIYLSFMFYIFQENPDLTKINLFQSDIERFQKSERSTDCLDIYFDFNDRDSSFFDSCNKINGSESIYYLIGDSHAWHLSNGLRDILPEDLFVTYFNGSKIPKPFFRKSEFTQNIIQNISLLNKNYNKVNIILSFHHLHAMKLSNYDEYYFDQINSYENFTKAINKINPSIDIYLIQDTPLPKDTAYSCDKFIQIFNNNSICDFKISRNYNILEKEIFMKLYDIVNIININDLVCEYSNCNFYDLNGYPIIWDGSHFTPQSEINISKEIFSLIK